MSLLKSLAVSKILYVAGMNLVPIGVIEQIQKIQKKFIWNGKKPKIKHTTLINEYQDGGLKDVVLKQRSDPYSLAGCGGFLLTITILGKLSRLTF